MAGAMRDTTTEFSANVQPGDCRFSSEGACRLIAPGLGSDIAITAHAPRIGLSALLRFVYPDSTVDPIKAKNNPWLFADTGVALLISTLRKCGAQDEEIEIQAVGAADRSEEELELPASGRSNELALRRALWREGVLLKGEDLGGETYRSAWFDPKSNRLMVRSDIQQTRTTSKPMSPVRIEHLAS